MMRKINAGLGLLTAVLLLDHAIFYSIWMLSRGSIATSGEMAPRMLAVIMLIHVILSMGILLSNRKDAKSKQYKKYCKLNMETYVQRISGILIIILMGVHIAGAVNHFHPKVLHAILHPLFFAAALAHVSVSIGRALITLGIGNARAIRIINMAAKVLCGAVFVAGVVGFYICLFMGVIR